MFRETRPTSLLQLLAQETGQTVETVLKTDLQTEDLLSDLMPAVEIRM
jgi:hypothetical protein